jgi:protein subunit release factor A
MASSVFDDKHRIFLGTHRVQRVSKTEKNGRRHTSFVLVYEIIEHEGGPVLKESDIRFEPFRGSGAGGQHRNKTDSCIRAVHVPSGVSVIATEQRSQHQNKKVARARLAERLATAGTEESILVDQQWNWCDWRNTVTLPSGKKKNLAQTYRRGL